MMIISEFVSSVDGIGNEMLTAQSTFNIPLMWQVIVLLGVLGIVLSALFALVERRVLAWQRVPAAAA
jgi:ABC-type nitrate/sulfonate/bicarbonate transport system permease component